MQVDMQRTTFFFFKYICSWHCEELEFWPESRCQRHSLQIQWGAIQMKHNCATSAREFVKLQGRCCLRPLTTTASKYCRNTGGLFTRCSNLRGGASERGLALFKTTMQTDHPMQTVNAASTICIFPCGSVRRIIDWLARHRPEMFI